MNCMILTVASYHISRNRKILDNTGDLQIIVLTRRANHSWLIWADPVFRVKSVRGHIWQEQEQRASKGMLFWSIVWHYKTFAASWNNLFSWQRPAVQSGGLLPILQASRLPILNLSCGMGDCQGVNRVYRFDVRDAWLRIDCKLERRTMHIPLIIRTLDQSPNTRGECNWTNVGGHISNELPSHHSTRMMRESAPTFCWIHLNSPRRVMKQNPCSAISYPATIISAVERSTASLSLPKF